MIDLHAHVLPGIDDGPPDVATSVALILAAEADGIRVLVATPHLRHDHPGVRLEELAEMCGSLERELPAESEIRIVPAGECDLSWAQAASAEELRLASFGQRGTDLLVETPYGALPPNFEELLFGLSLRGMRVVLAHPERNRTFQADPLRLAGLGARGVLLQVTAESVASSNRASESRRLARLLVRRGLAHVIASDTHSPGRHRASLSAGRLAAARLAPERAEWMVVGSPAAILAGEPLPELPSPESGRRWRPARRRWQAAH